MATLTNNFRGCQLRKMSCEALRKDVEDEPELRASMFKRQTAYDMMKGNWELIADS